MSKKSKLGISTLTPSIRPLDLGSKSPTLAKVQRDRTQVWYGLGRWKSIRKQQLALEPLCAYCQKEGRLEVATVCDHVTPHRGDEEAFWAGPFMSLCGSCHSSKKQREEHEVP